MTDFFAEKLSPVVKYEQNPVAYSAFTKVLTMQNFYQFFNASSERKMIPKVIYFHN